MGTIIGRQNEVKLLEKLLYSTESEFVVIYGRRRIGKTYLVQEFFAKKSIFFSLAGVSGGTQKEQLRRFASSLQAAFSLKEKPKNPKDWWEAFEMLEKQVRAYKGKKKITIFFDELPWLAGTRPFMLRALESSWNSFLAHKKKVIMVLCGSAAAWMIKKIIRNTKGLYGRITQKIHLQPFNLPETAQYLSAKGIKLDKQQIIDIFMVTGGVAKYLNHVEPGLSSAEVIQQLCFASGSFLSQEFTELFASLFDNSERHLQIIRTLGKVHYGLTHNDLARASKIPSGGGLKDNLDELEASGFVTSIPHYGNKKREAQYRVIDEYTLFYLKWMEGKGFVNNRPVSRDYWLSKQSLPEFKIWSGYAFENLCIKHIDLIISALHLPVVFDGISYWRAKPDKNTGQSGAQIDLLIERRDRCINLCEIKFRTKPLKISPEYAHKLNERKEIFRDALDYKGSVFSTLITPYGCDNNAPYSGSVDKSISLMDLI